LISLGRVAGSDGKTRRKIVVPDRCLAVASVLAS
jgi:hypothetical protein